MLLVKRLVKRFMEYPILGREVEGLKLILLVNFVILDKTAFLFSVKSFVIISNPLSSLYIVRVLPKIHGKKI